MTDWSKYKVADLKEECKSRDISLTGLKLKQQYVDKLEQYEAQETDRASHNAQEQAMEKADEQSALPVNGASSDPAVANGGEVERDIEKSAGQAIAADTPLPQNDIPGSDMPTPLQEEEKRADKSPGLDETLPTVQAPASADTTGVPGALFVPEVDDPDKETGEQTPDSAQETDQTPAQISGIEVLQPTEEGSNVPQTSAARERDTSCNPQSAELPSDSSTPRSSQIPPKDLAEDQRNRRKRSATPVPSSEDVSRKKARLSQDAREAMAEEAVERMKAFTELAKEIRNEPTDSQTAAVPVEKETDDAATAKPLVDRQRGSSMKEETQEETSSHQSPKSRSPSEERDIPPAMHPATSSLYISRLKRPIQPQAFRSHIISKAKSRSTDETGPITAFYLDSIKTHAFVSFTSVTAASRVRAAMHGVRFPDEASREPLFVDYVPDDQIQSWIDQETDSGFGRGVSGRRLFEVVYEKGEDGIEARFQEIDTSKPRPPLEPSRSSRMSFDRQQAIPAPKGVHPDRAALVPGDQRLLAPSSGPSKPSSDLGRGFKALDELFSSTTAKPKLYYKPVASSISNERLDMFRDLRVGYDEMGRSGDEGMKRFSFERSKDREEWVDKGPEFGHGRRGQERLAGGGGAGRGSFGGRGRGIGFRGRPMDSWRGGSTR